MNERSALLELLRQLRSRDYRFICVTPSTHRTVVERALIGEPSLRDIFGWNRPFDEGQLDPELLTLLRSARCVDQNGESLRSHVRVASLDGELFLHSSYPTESSNAVFFGPDTYRFARFVLPRLRKLPGTRHIVEMGAGSGAVGILAAKQLPSAEIALIDVNPVAAEFARINATAAGAEVQCIVSDRIPDGCDLVIANPPYLMDTAQRAYRDGGGLFGGDVACDWVSQALAALVPGGTMLLYTGAAMMCGRAPLLDRVEELCREAQARFAWGEIDPDVFGEELLEDGYEKVERIAAVGIEITTAR